MSSEVIPMQVAVPFAQMLQQKQAQEATGDSNQGSSSGADFDTKSARDEFKGLMPEWMLAAGADYAAAQKFGSDNGKLGQFVQAVVKAAAMVLSLTQALQGLSSFGAMKTFLSETGNFAPTKEGGEAGGLAMTLLSEINGFKTVGQAGQVEQEKSSEFNVLEQEAQSAGTKATNDQNTAKNLTDQTGNLSGDEGVIGGNFEQIAEGFAAIN